MYHVFLFVCVRARENRTLNARGCWVGGKEGRWVEVGVHPTPGGRSPEPCCTLARNSVAMTMACACLGSPKVDSSQGFTSENGILRRLIPSTILRASSTAVLFLCLGGGKSLPSTILRQVCTAIGGREGRCTPYARWRFF